MFSKSTLIISTVAVILFGLFAFSPTASAYQIGVSPNMLSLRSGLVGYWTFDGKDMAGGKALDKSGNGNHGSPVNIATSTFYTSGKIGQGLNFDGVNDYVSAGTGNNLNLRTSNFTFSLWFKIPASVAFSNLFNRADSGTGVGYIFETVSGKIRLRLNNVGYVQTPLTYIDNKWRHATGVRNGTSLYMYIDGVQVNPAADIAVADLSETEPLEIGSQWTGGTNYFKGSIDDIRIYNRALAPLEVRQLYNIGR